MTALLMLSGGLDSTLCAYQALAQSRPVHLHHISFRSHEGRQRHEDRATKAILKWLDTHGLDGYTYTESTWDYGTLRWIPKDVNVWAFVASVVLADPRHAHLDTLIVPRHLDAFGHVVDPAGQAARSNRLIDGFARLVAHRGVTIDTPLAEMRKADIVAALPPDLRRLCWWCRTPRAGRPCGRCITCRTVDPALEVAS